MIYYNRQELKRSALTSQTCETSSQEPMTLLMKYVNVIALKFELTVDTWYNHTSTNPVADVTR